MNLSKVFSNFVNYSSQAVGKVNAGLISIAAVSLNHQHQQIRNKSMIKRCGYLEHADMKKKDIRYKSATWHDPKRMNWQDYQVSIFKNIHLFL